MLAIARSWRFESSSGHHFPTLVENVRRLSKDSRGHVFVPMLWHIVRNHRAVFFDPGRHDDAAAALLADIRALGTIISGEAPSNDRPLPPSRIATIRDGTHAGRTTGFAKKPPRQMTDGGKRTATSGIRARPDSMAG